ncbi:S41 family peptidase [Brevundimonas sp. Root1423]|uniref:S41 family peptidase n=1 Tax=Brevundimonas sp. Root1423 TaxID=1736462 RepID=UPI0006F4EC47|nr:S41 family peptidase [Brevundimonas sp. Root1423]KQY96344.1 hypothetical protein ASD25_00135 [Brevundimonas sp. Root1423]
MIIGLTLSAAILLSLQTGPARPVAYDAERQVARAIEIARANSYRSALIDWPVLEERVHAAAMGARDVVDLLPAYVTLTQELGDNHSFVRPTQEVSNGWRDRHGGPLVVPRTQPGLPPITSTFRGRSAESSDTGLPGGKSARIIVIPRMSGGGPAADAYATQTVSMVLGAPEHTCGYVLDLRGNVGGNIWPMLAGLSPLLGEGPVGGTRDSSGRKLRSGRVERGVATAGEAPLATASGWRHEPRLGEIPVAVLIDDGVASSGEGVAIAFIGRPGARTFGQKTRGLATSNSEFAMGDGVTLGITTAMMIDRAGRAYPEGITPDEVIAADAGSGQQVDPVVDAAKTWLAMQPTCAPLSL